MAFVRSLPSKRLLDQLLALGDLDVQYPFQTLLGELWGGSLMELAWLGSGQLDGSWDGIIV